MSQKHFEILIELRPLETLFNTLSDEKAEIYCQQLSVFSIETVRAAVKKVAGKWDRVSFPPPGVIVQHCEQMQGTSTSTGMTGMSSLEEMWKRVVERANSYLWDFMKNSVITQDARRDGWDLYLHRYVREVAMYQSQLIEKRPYVMVLWHVICPENLSRSEGDKFRYRFLKEQQEIVARGNIEITIPNTKITEWVFYAARTKELAESRNKTGFSKSLGSVLPNISSMPPDPQFESPPIEAYL